jgi:hypothetical protein
VIDRPLDTSPEIHELYQFMLMQLTPEERFIRGAMMFDAARAMVLASLPKDLSPDELRHRLYERIYGEPLPADFPKENSGSPPTSRLRAADRS